MRFTQSQASPLCSPARFTILTGKYNFRNYTNWGVMNPNEKHWVTSSKVLVIKHVQQVNGNLTGAMLR